MLVLPTLSVQCIEIFFNHYDTQMNFAFSFWTHYSPCLNIPWTVEPHFKTNLELRPPPCQDHLLDDKSLPTSAILFQNQDHFGLNLGWFYRKTSNKCPGSNKFHTCLRPGYYWRQALIRGPALIRSFVGWGCQTSNKRLDGKKFRTCLRPGSD